MNYADIVPTKLVDIYTLLDATHSVLATGRNPYEVVYVALHGVRTHTNEATEFAVRNA